MPIEGLAGDPEFGSEVADLGAGLAHGGQGEPEFGRGHFVGASAVGQPARWVDVRSDWRTFHKPDAAVIARFAEQQSTY